jgi:CotH kinase protein/Secretion system C-terminal sorting domain
MTILFSVKGLAQQTDLPQSNLPIVIIDTKNVTIPDEPKITGELRIIFNGKGKINKITDAPTLKTRIGVELRGSTSQALFPKKPFAVEIRDSIDNDKNLAVLGLPTESDWVLIPSFNDKTLMRDALAYAFGREIMPYASRTQMVELMLNGVYWGVYMLGEKVKRGKDRVNIAKNDPAKDITGGYIIKLDKLTGADQGGWYSPFVPIDGKVTSTNYLYHYPKPEDITPEQVKYIKKYVTDWETIMKSPTYYEKYNEWMDLQSFVDYALINELTKNDDAYRLSTYLHKDKGGKLKMGPIWDFNIAFGNKNFCGGDNPKGWVWNYNNGCPEDQWLVPFYWGVLKKDNAFLSLFKKRWSSLRQNILSNSKVTAKIDSLAAVLDEGQGRNFKRWAILGNPVWPNKFVGKTYLEEVNYLKSWLTQRIAWIDGEVAAITPTRDESLNVAPVAAIFPNPFTNQIQVTLLENIKNYTYNLLIYNNIGELIKKTTLTGQQVISLENLPKGMYFYEIYNKEKIVQSNRLIKE